MLHSKKSHLKIFLIVFVVIQVTLACSLSGTEPSTSDGPLQEQITLTSKPTNTIVEPSQTALPSNTPLPSDTPLPPTQTPTPVPTKLPSGIIYQWSIQTGDLMYFAPLENGSIVAIGDSLGKGLYAKISKDGQVLNSNNKLDIKNCLRNNFSGGFTAKGISDWFAADTNGTMYTYSFTGSYGPCIIHPGARPTIKKFGSDYELFPYADGNRIRSYAPPPGNFNRSPSFNWQAHFWLDGRRTDFKVYFDNHESLLGFYSRNGKFHTTPLPEPAANLAKGGITFYITPWDDVYYHYNAYDELGNQKGEKIVRVKFDGKLENISNWPTFFDDSKKTIIYVPGKNILYAIETDGKNAFLRSYDLNFTQLSTYPMPSTFDWYDGEYTFVGYDLNLYVYKNKTLTKYAIVSGQ